MQQVGIRTGAGGAAGCVWARQCKGACGMFNRQGLYMHPAIQQVARAMATPPLPIKKSHLCITIMHLPDNNRVSYDLSPLMCPPQGWRETRKTLTDFIAHGARSQVHGHMRKPPATPPTTHSAHERHVPKDMDPGREGGAK
jgi:hypothetical protein